MTLRCREQAEVRPPHSILGLLIGALPFTPNGRFGKTSLCHTVLSVKEPVNKCQDLR
jgi:hypothetical protein